MKKIILIVMCMVMVFMTGESEFQVSAEPSCDELSVQTMSMLSSGSYTGDQRVFSPPEANFDYDVQGLRVNFWDLSSGSVQSWFWHFNDGCGSNEQNPSHIFSEPGVYSVALRVNNSAGSETVVKKIQVTLNYWLPLTFR